MRSNSTASTASTNHGKPPRHCNCDTAIRVASTPTSSTVESSPAPSTTTSGASPRLARHRRPERHRGDHRVDERTRRQDQRRHPAARIETGQIDDTAASRSVVRHAHVGDIVVTRRNDRRLARPRGEPVRNREPWTVTGDRRRRLAHRVIESGSGTVTLPAEYAREHVRLGYAATEHGNQGDTVTVGIELATAATTRRGLYVASPEGTTRTRSWSSPRATTSTKPATSSKACSPATEPTCLPPRNAASWPTPDRAPPAANQHCNRDVRFRHGSNHSEPESATTSPRPPHEQPRTPRRSTELQRKSGDREAATRRS